MNGSSIDPQQIIGPLRIILPALLWIASSRGWFDSAKIGPTTEAVVNIVPALVTTGAAIWSFLDWAKHNLIKRVAEMPQVEAVVTDEKTASSPRLKDVPNVVSQAP